MERTLTSVEEEMILQIEEIEKQLPFYQEVVKHRKAVIIFLILTILWTIFGISQYNSMNIGGIFLFVILEFIFIIGLIKADDSHSNNKTKLRQLLKQKQDLLDKLAIFKVKYDPETKKVEFMD